jgi:hypothetical protein
MKDASRSPHLDAGAVTSIVHADIVYENVLNNINNANVLAEGANGNPMRPVAPQALNEDLCTVWFERNTVVRVVDARILDDNVRGAVGVPTVSLATERLATLVVGTRDFSFTFFAGFAPTA